MLKNACLRCGSRLLWVPTFCNFGHCAECFEACEPYDDEANSGHECGWDGSEHESYGPASGLPGSVWIRGDKTKERPEDV